MDAERWQQLSTLLDAMLEVDAATRARHLAALRSEDPALAADVEGLLANEVDAEDFLSEPLVPPLPGARAGSSIGPYRLERLIGEGGMGQVWLARRDDGMYQRRVALKLLRPGFADANLRLRFTRERQILARLEHPHIARLLDAGISADNQPYLALEYVEGEAITDWCRARALTLDKRIALFLQVCAAVSHAHANLIVHRDLKPSNILVTALDEARLLDFGIAKLLDSVDNAPDNTRTGLRAFTLHYAAPEQVRGEPVTTMTDVYSLGVVLYELLTDSRPYRLTRQTDAEWEEAILLADPLRPSVALHRNADSDAAAAPALRRRARALSGDLDNIVLKTLAKRPEQRYPSVEALSLDLQRYLDGKPVLARPQSLAYRVRKYFNRHRWALVTAALVLVVFSAALGIVAWQARQAVREASRAQALQDFVIGLFENAGSTPDGSPLDVRQLLAAGVERGDRELATQPVARAELFGVIARLRLGLGDYEQALALLHRQAAIVATSDAPPSLRLESAADMGRAQRRVGLPLGCIATMQPMQAVARREEPALPVQVSDFYSELGRCRRATGQPNIAQQLFQRSIALRRDRLDDSKGVVENFADLAGVQADSGHPHAALQAYLAATSQLQAAGAARDPLGIELLRSIAVLQAQLGDRSAAQASYRRALALSDALLGPTHRDNVDLHGPLAQLLAEDGSFIEARAELVAVQGVVLQRWGPASARHAENLEARAMIHWQLDELESARKLLEQAIAIRRRAAASAGLVLAIARRAAVLQEQAQPRRARNALEALPRLPPQTPGNDGALLRSEAERLAGEILAAQGDAAALPHLQRAVALATTRNDAPGTVQRRQAALSLAHWQAVHGDQRTGDDAWQRLQAMAADDAADRASRHVQWQASAYAAQFACRGPERTRAIDELDAVGSRLAQAYPQGGIVRRQVEAIRAGCVRGSRQARL